MQSRFLKSVENWSFETDITKIQCTDAIFIISAIWSNFSKNPKLDFLDKITY
jgi:hypothetical protein